MSAIVNTFKKVFGDANSRALKKYWEKVKEINALEDKISKLSDEELKHKTVEFREFLKKRLGDNLTKYVNNGVSVGENETEHDIVKQEIKDALDEILPEAFAVVREASKRTLGMRHFDVQLIGGMVLHDGCIAEMKTGEGKTLVATLAVYLNALTGRGVHVITVNDYLVKRDSEWMGRLYTFLGLTVGKITDQTPLEERKQEYAKDITYVTNSEIGFDYLRDNMKTSTEEMSIVSRGFNFCVVDEVDSILIDESRTPLIISGPTSHDPQMYIRINNVVKQLVPADYEIDEKRRNVQLTEAGNTHIEQILRNFGILKTGEDLYGTQTFALWNFILQALRAHTLFKNGVDYIVKDGEAVIIDEFTGRIMDGRRYSDGLHQAIEAKEGLNIMPENQTLASVTYQNFFRMYDKLSGMTGTANTEASEFFDIYKLSIVQIPTNKPITRKSLDDLVFKNEEEKFNAIVKTVKEAHEKGQPVLLGTVSIEKSEILSKLLTKEGIKHNLLNAKYHEKEAKIIAEAGRFGAVTIATNMAGRGTDIMLGGNVQKEIDDAIAEAPEGTDLVKLADEITNAHKDERQKVVDAGGLFVIGSERHESRRIDNQLIGRSGRQGDPGKTQFYLSLHDNLLRIFGGEKIDKIMSMVGFKGGEAMNSPMLTNIINKSQKKVETYHYEVRKNLLKYDDIVNEQRKMIYSQRMTFVMSSNINNIFKQMVNDVNTDILSRATVDREIEPAQVKELLLQEFGIEKSAVNMSSYEVEKINNLCLLVYSQMFSNVDIIDLGEIQRRVMLGTLDECWREHLYTLDHLKEGIHLRAYAQKDPFNEYKFESYNLMQKTMNDFVYLVVNRLFNMRIEIKKPDEQ